MFLMKESEFVVDYFSRFSSLTIKIKSSMETLSILGVIEKILCTFTPQYGIIILKIEEKIYFINIKIRALRNV